MKDHIAAQRANPEVLEQLYRSDKTAFRKAFPDVFTEYKDEPLIRAWQLRLADERKGTSWGAGNEFYVILALAILAGSLIKLPLWFGWDEERFYSRNAGFLILPLLAGYFLYRKGTGPRGWLLLGLFTIIPAVYMNLLPLDKSNDIMILACIHSVLLMWSVAGFGFGGFQFTDLESRIRFLRFNGDMAIMGSVMGAVVGALAGITIGLFNLIGIDISELYARNVLIYEMSAVPFLTALLVISNPQLVEKVSPLVARIFSPVVLVTLSFYLVAILVSGKDPYNDREFLVQFNLLLIGVMAIILFSIAGTSGGEMKRWEEIVLWLLSLVTIIVNLIAVSAILFRISEFGFTPNRTAVLGSNLLILANMLQLTLRLFGVISGHSDRVSVEQSIARFLPLYAAWTVIVVLLFPLMF